MDVFVETHISLSVDLIRRKNIPFSPAEITEEAMIARLR